MSIEEENKAVLRRWLDEMWIHGKFRDLMPELAGPEYIRHHSNGTFTVNYDENVLDRIILFWKYSYVSLSLSFPTFENLDVSKCL